MIKEKSVKGKYIGHTEHALYMSNRDGYLHLISIQNDEYDFITVSKCDFPKTIPLNIVGGDSIESIRITSHKLVFEKFTRHKTILFKNTKECFDYMIKSKYKNKKYTTIDYAIDFSRFELEFNDFILSQKQAKVNEETGIDNYQYYLTSINVLAFFRYQKSKAIKNQKAFEKEKKAINSFLEHIDLDNTMI